MKSLLSRHSGMAGCAVFLLSCGYAQARAWPDTSAGIFVLADQLPGSLTAAQRQFAATRLAGTQKQLLSQIQALRVYNTNFLCLHYQLAVGCGEHSFIEGNNWTSDWTYINAQTNWFLHNAQTQRVHQTQWDWDVMDISYSGDNPNTGFPGYWMTSCLARIAAADNDAVFADSFTINAYAFGLCNPSHLWFEDVDLCLSNWIPNLERFGTAITNAFHADGRGYLFIPNVGSMITVWDTMKNDMGDGVMIEGFCLERTGLYYDPDDWRLQMNRALPMVRTNKIVICQSNLDTDDYAGRMFVTTSYLLIKGCRTYLNMLTTGRIELEYYPEYTIDLKGALTPTPADLSALWHAGWGVYRRAYTNGIVLVNPGGSSIDIPDLGADFNLVHATGGGAVDAVGAYGGSLNASSVTGLSLAAYSGAVLLYATNGGGSGGSPGQPTNLAALHRAGQTFITWGERSDLSGESYRIYRHSQPITAANLPQATPLYRVWEDSSVFYANRYDDEGTWRYRYAERFTIVNNGPQLAAGTGLLVWTLTTNDFAEGTTGSAYYAVTTFDSNGTENAGSFTAANAIGPIGEGLADPLPVRLTNNVGERGHLYIQYMNLREWNPTFHAPHAANNYYGLNPTTPAVTSAIQYAYDYLVYEPECASNPAPAYLNLHGWGGNTYGPAASDPDGYDWCAYKIFPVDQSETWFFGFARNHDYRNSAAVAAGDTAANYTERRILRMLYDLIRAPPGPAVDINRLYVYGHSMGGSGALALALRYPNVFAAAYASQPMTDYRTSGDGGGTDWRDDVAIKWGDLTLNLPVVLDGPGGWADHLKKFNGTGVWDWQNHRSNLLARMAENIVPIGIGHGTNDASIEWSTQGRPVYQSFDAARQAWGGAINSQDHSWMSFYGLPPNLNTDESLVPFRNFAVCKNESVPGLSQAGGNAPIPATGTGTYNLAIEWSSSWNDWDGRPTDTVAKWSISLRTLDGIPHTAAVTPRRLQNFLVFPGTPINWSNLRVSDDVEIQNGMLRGDNNGLLLVTNFAIGSTGNRLRMEIDTLLDINANGLPDYWEAQYFGGPTNAIADADSDEDGSNNGDEFSAGTDPTNRHSVFQIAACELQATNFLVNWSSVTGRYYRVMASMNLPNGFTQILRSGIAATAPTNRLFFTPGMDGHSVFFSVGIE